MNPNETKPQVAYGTLPPVVGPCPKCNGTGYRHYDHNHMKVCEFCCKHDQGWWDLSPMHYGYIAGGENRCCKAGCGTLLRDINTPNPSVLLPPLGGGKEQRVVGRPSDLTKTKEIQ